MADTPRTLAQLLALAPDNTSGLISPQDLRDMLVSLYPSRGQFELATGGATATTFSGANVYTSVKGTTQIDTTVCTTCVTMPGNGQLAFTKAVEQVALVNATLEVLPSANNQRYTFTFAVNGTPKANLAYTAYYGNLGGNPAAVFLSGLVRIAAGDVLSVVVRNDTDTHALTAQTFTVSAIGVIT